MLLFPAENKHDLNGLCPGLGPEMKQGPHSKEPVTNVNPVLLVSLPLLLLINTSLMNEKLAGFFQFPRVSGQPAGQRRAPDEQSVKRQLVRSKVMGQNLEEKSTAGGSRVHSCHRLSR